MVYNLFCRHYMKSNQLLNVLSSICFNIKYTRSIPYSIKYCTVNNLLSESPTYITSCCINVLSSLAMIQYFIYRG